MKNIYSFLLILISTVVVAQNPHWEWISGVQASFAEPAKALATDTQGNMYTYGSFINDIITDNYEIHNTNPQNQDSYFVKLNNQGEVQWTKKIGGMGAEIIWGLDTDTNGNIYLTGTYTNGVTIENQSFTGLGTFFAKYNTNGELLWLKIGSFTFMSVLRVDANGNIYAAGTFQGSFTYDGTTLTYPNTSTSFIVKLDNSGNLVWSGLMQGPQNSSERNNVTDIEIDNSGNVFVSGTFNNSEIVFGNVVLNSISYGNIFLVKYNSEGVAQWGNVSGNSTCSNLSWDITLDNSGNIYLTGSYCGTLTFGTTTVTAGTGAKFYIAKCDNTTGAVAWVKSTTEGAFNAIHSADVDDNGNLIVAGTFLHAVNFGNNISLTSDTSAQYVAFYNAEGLAQWAVATSEIDINNTISVKAMGNNTIYTAGHMQRPSLSFGDITYTRAGENLYNIWLGKLVYEDVAATPQFNISAISVYPNPVNDILTVESKNPVLNLSIADCNGRIVATATNSSIINTALLSKGIYFVAVTTNSGKSTYKIVKN